jgi:hypothetical protein
MRMDPVLRRGLNFSVIIVMVLVCVVPSALALDSDVNRETLRGLKGVRVLVEDLASEVGKAGLTKNQLQADIEDKLRKAGIKALTQDECFATPGEPYLYVNINLNFRKADPNIYSFSMDIGVIQNVTLDRDPKQKTYAATWSTGGVGSIEKEFLPRLKDSVDDLLNLFIKSYLAVNPKK